MNIDGRGGTAHNADVDQVFGMNLYHLSADAIAIRGTKGITFELVRQIIQSLDIFGRFDTFCTLAADPFMPRNAGALVNVSTERRKHDLGITGKLGTTTVIICHGVNIMLV